MVQEDSSGRQELEGIFHPRSIAVVGVSLDEAGWGQRYLFSLMQFGYRGNLFPVGRQGGEIAGLKFYESLLDIPAPVDYVICCLPAPFTPRLVADCVSKGVKAVQFFTSGFSETGDDDGRMLEQTLLDTARSGRVRLIGPNCLGIYYPAYGLTILNTVPRLARSGKVGFLFQSGGNSQELIEIGTSRGIYFSKGVSYGNACDLNESDFLEYLAQDDDTEVIGLYIEGVKQGERFFKALSGVARVKPTIILKGGRTVAGSQAAASHTGSLSGAISVWRAVCRQTGAILVNDLDEMMDLMIAFSYLKPMRGRRAGIIGISGGRSVQSADSCESYGFSVPPFSPETRRKLLELTPREGSSIRNPVDSYLMSWDPVLFSRALRLLGGYGGVDFLVVDISLIVSVLNSKRSDSMEKQVEAIGDFRKICSKPLMVVLSSEGVAGMMELGAELQQKLISAGIPVYPSMKRAACALDRFVSYHAESR
ncbi:MAG: CoA-binding protein [Dehalococcoidia bacterium]|nr:CoA-binding protein [Dehalococcoidia bacterium]